MSKKTENLVFQEKLIDKSVDVVSKFYNMGRQNSAAGYYYRPHIHEEYEFVYMVEGELKTRIDGEEFAVSKGDVYFVQPGQQHEEVSESGFVSFYYVKCNFYCSDGRIAYITKDISKQIITKGKAEFKKIFEKMFREIKNRQLGYWQMMEALVVELLCCALRSFVQKDSNIPLDMSQRKENYGNKILDKAVEYMRENESKLLSVEEIASAISVSESYLFTLFKKQLSVSPIKFMMTLKMTQAKIMLIRTDLPITVIAKQYGFDDVSHFSKVFKKICEVSPKEYRKQCKKEN